MPGLQTYSESVLRKRGWMITFMDFNSTEYCYLFSLSLDLLFQSISAQSLTRTSVVNSHLKFYNPNYNNCIYWLIRHIRYPMNTLLDPERPAGASRTKNHTIWVQTEPQDAKAWGYQDYTILNVFSGVEELNFFFDWIANLLEHKKTKTQKYSKFSSCAPFYLVSLCCCCC